MKADQPTREPESVLIAAPTGKDAALIARALCNSNIPSRSYATLASLAAGLGSGAAAVIVAEEALDEETPEALQEALSRQPPWSDLPILLLARPGADSATVQDAAAALRNVTLIERPMATGSLISAVRSALRARERQHQLRHHLEALARSERDLRAADRQKDEFLAMLAHELRNPLGPLRNAVEVWRMSDPREAVIGDMREVIDRQVTHLSHLVDDLLDLSRITTGKVVLRRENVDLSALVRRVVHDRSRELEAGELCVTCDVPDDAMWVHGDTTRLAQCCSNLLQNAAKFTDAGGKIVVSLGRDEALGQAILTVQDSGIGMEPDTVERLFSAFVQADRSLDRSRGGLGLGLAVVRGLITLHGGIVEAASDGPGQGSTFTVRLPLAEAAKDVTRQTTPAPARKVLRVLVIDDRRDATLTLSALLSTLGHQVQTAGTAEEGLRIAAQWRPDAIISDIGLPDADGYTVARRARQDPAVRDALLVALSGYGRPEDQRKASDAGFDYHLTKPAALKDLLRVLGRA